MLGRQAAIDVDEFHYRHPYTMEINLDFGRKLFLLVYAYVYLKCQKIQCELYGRVFPKYPKVDKVSFI